MYFFKVLILCLNARQWKTTVRAPYHAQYHRAYKTSPHFKQKPKGEPQIDQILCASASAQTLSFKQLLPKHDGQFIPLKFLNCSGFSINNFR